MGFDVTLSWYVFFLVPIVIRRLKYGAAEYRREQNHVICRNLQSWAVCISCQWFVSQLYTCCNNKENWAVCSHSIPMHEECHWFNFAKAYHCQTVRQLYLSTQVFYKVVEHKSNRATVYCWVMSERICPGEAWALPTYTCWTHNSFWSLIPSKHALHVDKWLDAFQNIERSLHWLIICTRRLQAIYKVMFIYMLLLNQKK
jgi:hypothetical protein